MVSATPSSAILPAAKALLSARADRLSSDEIFKGRQEIVIQHDGQDYRLRVTSQNRLILTK